MESLSGVMLQYENSCNTYEGGKINDGYLYDRHNISQLCAHEVICGLVRIPGEPEGEKLKERKNHDNLRNHYYWDGCISGICACISGKAVRQI